MQRLLQSQIAHHVLLGIPGHRPQWYDDNQENQSERCQYQRERDLVGGSLADGSFHQYNHAIQEGFTSPGRDANNDLIGKHARAASYAGTIASRSPNHRSGFAGDRRFVDRSNPLNNFSVAWDNL